MSDHNITNTDTTDETETDTEAHRVAFDRVCNAVDDTDLCVAFNALIRVYGYIASQIDCPNCRGQVIGELGAAIPTMLRIADEMAEERAEQAVEAAEPQHLAVH